MPPESQGRELVVMDTDNLSSIVEDEQCDFRSQQIAVQQSDLCDSLDDSSAQRNSTCSNSVNISTLMSSSQRNFLAMQFFNGVTLAKEAFAKQYVPPSQNEKLIMNQRISLQALLSKIAGGTDNSTEFLFLDNDERRVAAESFLHTICLKNDVLRLPITFRNERMFVTDDQQSKDLKSNDYLSLATTADNSSTIVCNDNEILPEISADDKSDNDTALCLSESPSDLLPQASIGTGTDFLYGSDDDMQDRHEFGLLSRSLKQASIPAGFGNANAAQLHRATPGLIQQNEDKNSSDRTVNILINPKPQHVDVINWEQNILERGIADGDVIFATRHTLLSVTSFLTYKFEKFQRVQSSIVGNLNYEMTERERRYGVSYAYMLQAPARTNYDPFFLDDPNIKSGRHRIVLSLPGLTSSVLGYVRNKDFKQELNEKFRDKHEWMHPSMSLSKIRRVKELLVKAGRQLDLEISTVALAFVYFERLCVKNVVTKQNRRAVGALSLVLAVKYNEGLRKKRPVVPVIASRAAASLVPALSTTVSRATVPSIRRIIDTLEKIMVVRRADIMRLEFAVFVQLDFDLSVQPGWIDPWLQAIEQSGSSSF